MDLYWCVESDHAGDTLARWLMAWFMVSMNTALIQWTSRTQSDIVTSAFNAVFVD